MRDPLIRAAVSWLILFTFSTHLFGQQRKPALVCKRAVLTASKAKPELSYQCDDEANDWDEKILKLPARISAIKTLIAELSSFSGDVWWAADIVDLSVCDFTHKPGTLTRDQRQSFLDG